MKVKYRGFELESKREKCLGGWDQVYDTAYRIEDRWEMICTHSDDEDTLITHIESLKSTIDDYYEHPEDYDDDLPEFNSDGFPDDPTGIEEAYKDHINIY